MLRVPTLALASAFLAFAQLQVVEDRIPVLSPDSSGNASVVLTLKNANPEMGIPVPQDLSLTDFVHQGPRMYGLNAVASFELVGPQKAQNITKNTVAVKISVSHLWDAGESVAVFKNAGVPVKDSSGKQNVELHAMRIPPAYNVQFETANPEVVFSPDSSPSVRLVNHDAMTYTFKWEFRPQGQHPSLETGPIILPANGKFDLDLCGLMLPVSFWQAGTLKDGSINADLLLMPQLGATPTPPQSATILPLRVRLRYWPSIWQNVAKFFWTGVLLLVGALLSLWFRVYIPNAVGAVKIRRELDAMQVKTDGTGSDLPAQWNVLIIGCINGIRRKLTDMFWFFPAFTTRVTELQTSTEMCGQWVEIAYGVSVLLGEAARKAQMGLSSTLRDLIEQKCNEALKPIATGFTTLEELQSMKAALALARDYVQAAQNDTTVPDVDAIIKAREALINPDDFEPFPPWLQRFHCLFSQWQKMQKDSSRLPHKRDAISRKVYLLSQFKSLHDRLCCTPAPHEAEVALDGQSQAASSACERLTSKMETFFSYLDPDSYESLRMAHVFLEEMRQDFYPEALLEQTRAGAIDIHAYPVKPYPSETPQEAGNDIPLSVEAEVPTRFTLRFQRAALNEIAALQEWTCYWEFGDGGYRESGWDVYHIYRKKDKHPLKVCLKVCLFDIRGAKIMEKPKIVQVNGESDQRTSMWGWMPAGATKFWPLSPEAKVEASRLVFTLSIALAGVYATARTQVESLDLLKAAGALIALGFGVDVVKTLLTQNSEQGGKAK